MEDVEAEYTAAVSALNRWYADALNDLDDDYESQLQEIRESYGIEH